MASVQTPEATIVVPTRHEEGSVGPLLERIHHATVDRHGHIEVLFIDDSDNQKTVEAIHHARHRLRSQHLLIDVIHRPRDTRENGLAGAIVHGIRHAKSDRVINMDGDGQHPPEILPVIIERVQNGSDIVSTSRYIDGGSNDGLDGTFRKFVSRAAGMVSRALFPKGLAGITDPMTGYFAVKREKLNMDALTSTSGFKILLAILAYHPHLKRTEVPLQFEARQDGESKAGEGNGAEFLKQLPALRFATLPPFANFALGGGTIAVFGAALMAALVFLGVPALTAFGINLGVTVAMNFTYNKLVTWKGQTNGTLRRQIMLFVVTRALTLAGSYYSFPWLVAMAEQYDPLHMGLQLHSQAANVVCLVGSTVINFATSRWLFEEKGRRRHQRPGFVERHAGYLKMAVIVVVPVGLSMIFIGLTSFVMWLLVMSVGIALLSLFSATIEHLWRLHGRRTPEARKKLGFPDPVRPEKARLSFTFLVAALHEAAVIGSTLRRLANQTHPYATTVATLVEGDEETIDVVRNTIARSPQGKLTMVARSYTNGSKAHQLNHALDVFPGDDDTNFVCPEDAETRVPEELAAHVEPLIHETGADVVQCAVVLVNTRVPRHKNWSRFARFPRIQAMLRPFFESRFWAMLRSWFVALNGLEYFFNWSSRSVYQADNGFMLFGGNTIFIRRGLLRQVAGWPSKLTEDAFLAAKMKRTFPDLKIVAAYDPKLAAREETPPRMFGKGGWLLQRVRWVQGFIEVLVEGDWAHLPTYKQRALAFYSLAMPLVQGLTAIMLPFGIIGMFMLKAPVFLVIVMFSPFILTLATVMVQVQGMREMSRDLDVKYKAIDYVFVCLGGFAYQVMLGIAAIIAIKRHLTRQTAWEHTQHVGSHDDEDELMPELVGAGSR